MKDRKQIITTNTVFLTTVITLHTKAPPVANDFDCFKDSSLLYFGLTYIDKAQLLL